MLPELFTLPILNRPIFSYGVMLVIGLLVGIEIAKFLARRSGLNPEHFVTAGILAIAFGIVGARVVHILQNFPEYTRSDLPFWQNLWNAANVTSGGLVYYGGVLLATPVLIAYARWKKVPVLLGMDIIAPVLVIALGFGRIGCFLNGCCWGGACEVEWAPKVSFPYHSPAYQDEVYDPIHPLPVPPELLVETDDGRSRLKRPDEVAGHADLRAIASAQHSRALHPAQLYSTITAWLLGAILLAYFTLPHAAGRGFAWMLVLEGFTRFTLELLRDEPVEFRIFGAGLSFSMGIGLMLCGVGIVLWFAFGKIAKRGTQCGVQPAASVT